MRKLNRPQKHPDFEKSKSKKKWELEKFRKYFRASQEDKCGYCEMVTMSGAIDHFRPQKAVYHLEEKFKRVDEIEEYSRKLKFERKRQKNTLPGYPWLKNEWSNYVYSCSICNSIYKRNFFPLLSKKRATQKNKKIIEKLALINPFDNLNPCSHFVFLKDGSIHAMSVRGEHSIVTYGLYRLSLTKQRNQHSATVYRLCEELVSSRNPLTSEDSKVKLQWLYSLGRNKAPHCGMVRNIIELKTKMKWDEFVVEISKYITPDDS